MMEQQNTELRKYFEKKILDRLFLIASHEAKSTNRDKGVNCLNKYNKNANPAWSSRFFLLLLDSWIVWGEKLYEYDEKSNKTKIRKRYEQLMNQNGYMPSKQSYYNYIEDKNSKMKQKSDMSSSKLSMINSGMGVNTKIQEQPSEEEESHDSQESDDDDN